MDKNCFDFCNLHSKAFRNLKKNFSISFKRGRRRRRSEEIKAEQNHISRGWRREKGRRWAKCMKDSCAIDSRNLDLPSFHLALIPISCAMIYILSSSSANSIKHRSWLSRVKICPKFVLLLPKSLIDCISMSVKYIIYVCLFRRCILPTISLLA